VGRGDAVFLSRSRADCCRRPRPSLRQPPGKAGGDLGAEAGANGKVDLKAALASPNRVAIDTPRVTGSINLVGARIDDIELKDYRETVKKDSGPVRLFAPEGTPGQYFAEFGFVTGGARQPSTALWQADGTKLTPETPVTLTRTDDAGSPTRSASRSMRIT
jgi:YidC/Oxa1 family membrane protein insertase